MELLTGHRGMLQLLGHYILLWLLNEIVAEPSIDDSAISLPRCIMQARGKRSSLWLYVLYANGTSYGQWALIYGFQGFLMSHGTVDLLPRATKGAIVPIAIDRYGSFQNDEASSSSLVLLASRM